MTAKKKPFSGRQWERFSAAVGVAGSDIDSNDMFCDIPVPLESASRSLCGETGAEVEERVDDSGGPRILNLDPSCWVEAFFLGPVYRLNVSITVALFELTTSMALSFDTYRWKVAHLPQPRHSARLGEPYAHPPHP